MRLSAALAQTGQVTAEIRLLILAAEDDAAAPFRGRDTPQTLLDRQNVFDLSDLSDQELDSLLFQYGSLAIAIGPGISSWFFSISSAKCGTVVSDCREFLPTYGTRWDLLRRQPGMIGKMDELYQMLIVRPFPNYGLLDNMLRAAGLVVLWQSQMERLATQMICAIANIGDDWLMAAGVNSTDAGIQFRDCLNPYGRIALLLINAAIKYGET